MVELSVRTTNAGDQKVNIEKYTVLSWAEFQSSFISFSTLLLPGNAVFTKLRLHIWCKEKNKKGFH